MNDQTGDDPTGTAPISADMPPAPGPEGELIDGQWRPGAWNGLPMLTCVHCGWDTLEGIDVARARAAICPRCRPPEPEPKPPPAVLRADRWGNPVQSVEG